jgi:mannosyltransferase
VIWSRVQIGLTSGQVSDGVRLVRSKRLANGAHRRSRDLFRNRVAWMVLAITVLGAALRFSTLGLQSYWYDEAVTVGLLRSSLLHMLRLSADTESTPPLYYVLAWIWARIFGTSEVGLRSLSATLGTLVIPVAFVAGKELVSRRAGVLAAALTAVSPFLTWYSQEARAYSLLVFLGALSLVFCARGLKRPTRRALWSWAVMAALALWTAYFALFLVAAEAAALVVSRHSRRVARAPIAGVALATIAVFPLAYHQANNQTNDWIGRIPLHDRVYDAARWFVVGPSYSIRHVWWIVAAVCCLGLASILVWSVRRERRSAAIAGTLGGACVLLPVVPAVLGSDYWLYRNLIAGWIPLAVALAAGIATEARVPLYVRGGLIVAAAALVVLPSILTIKLVSGNGFERQNWRGVARCLGEPQASRALVVAPGYERVSLGLYRPIRRLESGGRRFREIDLIGNSAPSFTEFTLPTGFRRAGESCGDAIPIYRYRAAQPLQVKPPNRDAALLVDEVKP